MNHECTELNTCPCLHCQTHIYRDIPNNMNLETLELPFLACFNEKSNFLYYRVPTHLEIPGNLRKLGKSYFFCLKPEIWGFTPNHGTIKTWKNVEIL